MTKDGRIGIGLVLSTCMLLSPARVWAQFGPPPALAGTTGSTALGVGNPYLNPALNPYLNPAITQQPMNANNALLYLYAANSARGGIGSGQLSNPRISKPASKAAELPNSASTPGAGASKFFNPGPGNANTSGRYYNRRGRYFLNNGR